MKTTNGEVRVWDPFVRFFHWGLVLAFLVSITTEGDPRWLHVGSGYFIASLLILRVVWGFIGSRHARFSDFVRGPREVLEHLRDVASFRARRYLGHDPAGGAMIIALLFFLSLTVFTGLLLYGAKDHKGPFAGFQVAALTEKISLAPTAYASSDDDDERKAASGGKENNGEEWLEDVHGTFATIVLILAAFHLGGVLAVSYQTHENLIMGMLTGRKKPVPEAVDSGALRESEAPRPAPAGKSR